MSDTKQDLIEKASREDIDRWVAKYPAEQKQSAVMAALRIVQDQNGGYLTTELMDAVAGYLEMDRIAVYEVASFYSMFELKPVGRNKLCVCTNISCSLSGSEEVVDYLKKKTGIGLGETTADGMLTLKEVECLGACCNAPVIQHDRVYHENLTPEKIDSLLDSLE